MLKTVLEVCCEVAKSRGYKLKEVYKTENNVYKVVYFQNTKYKWKSIGSCEFNEINRTPLEIYNNEFDNQPEITSEQKIKEINEYKLEKI